MALSAFSRDFDDLRRLVEEWVRGNPRLFVPEPPRIEQIRGRKRGPPKNYWRTVWGLMLRDPEVQIPTSRLGKLFRLRFRMSWDLYHNHLLPMVVEANIFPVRQEKQIRVPLEIKILICLRQLCQRGQ